MRLPGTRLLTLARLIIDPGVVTRALEPLVADWQREYLSADSPSRRSAVRVRGMAAFPACAVRCLAISDVPAALRYRAWLTLLLFAGTGTFVNVLPYVLRYELSPQLLGWLLPACLLSSVPFAMLPLAIRVSATGHGAGRSDLTRLTLASAVFAVVLSGWSVPYANQAFRERMVYRLAEAAGAEARYRPPVRGLRELTGPELAAIASSGRWQAMSPAQVNEAERRFEQVVRSPESAGLELHRRLMSPAAVILLAIIGWCLGQVSPTARTGRLMFWWGFVATTAFLAPLASSWGTPRPVAVWLPLALWSGAIVILMRAVRSVPETQRHR